MTVGTWGGTGEHVRCGPWNWSSVGVVWRWWFFFGRWLSSRRRGRWRGADWSLPSRLRWVRNMIQHWVTRSGVEAHKFCNLYFSMSFCFLCRSGVVICFSQEVSSKKCTGSLVVSRCFVGIHFYGELWCGGHFLWGCSCIQKVLQLYAVAILSRRHVCLYKKYCNLFGDHFVS